MSDDKLSIEFDDNDKDYLALNKFLEDDTNRKKNQILSDIENNGEFYLKEIEKKNERKNQNKKKYMPYILKHSLYGEEELLSYSLEDVIDIYKEIKENKKSWIIKLFDFLLSN